MGVSRSAIGEGRSAIGDWRAAFCDWRLATTGAEDDTRDVPSPIATRVSPVAPPIVEGSTPSCNTLILDRSGSARTPTRAASHPRSRAPAALLRRTLVGARWRAGRSV